MTFDDAVRAVARAWWVLAAGFAVTLVVMATLLRIPGVYTAQVDLVALPPHDPAPRNVLLETTASLSPFAWMVAAEASQGATTQDTGTAGTLYGAGVREGFKVTVPNTGGQWNFSHDRPVISVEVVGPSEEFVESTLETLVHRVQRDAARIQSEAGVDSSSTITFDPSPAVLTGQVQYVGGQRMRAAAATLATGTALSLGAAAACGRRLGRRRRARADEGAPEPPAARQARTVALAAPR
jgi:hypothetical protein